jgi:hypothetical protein
VRLVRFRQSTWIASLLEKKMARGEVGSRCAIRAR